MPDTFATCLSEVLRHEGGYVNHPRDPGGMTNLGVTKKAWDEYTGKSATEADMRALTPSKVTAFYRARYWNPCLCDQLPAGLALCVFDFAVNAGPTRSARYLQKLVGASVDGQIGPATIAAVYAMARREGAAAMVRGFQNCRRAYYHGLSTFDTFGRGWLRRVDAVETAALRLVP